MTPFVHLHLHTEYSLLDGACRVGDVIEAAVENQMPAVSITDHGVMYGVIPFYQAAADKGVKPIIGCEVYVATGSRKDRKSEGPKSPNHHLVLLATNERGYRNLIRLVTAAHTEGFYYKPRIDKELLAGHHEGLIGLSSCLKGEVAESLVNDDEAGALRVAGEYAEILGQGRFYLEVQDHGMAEQRKANRALVALAARTGLPLVATNDVHYLKQEHAAAHEVLLCLQTQTLMSDPKRMRYPSTEFFLKSGAQMAELFREIPQAVTNTLRVAEQCNLELIFDQLHFPIFKAPGGADQKGYLVDLCRAGLQRLYGLEELERPRTDRDREVVERFRHEIDVIEKTGFINYFLVVWDFVHFARSHGIPVGPGRGSGAGSLVAYALGITGIDPLRYGLIFERFLNPERISPPDFDIDFCQTRRGEVIEYVRDKYGRENVAQIITFGSLGAKTVIRDVGRVLEIPFAECDRLSKMVPDDPKITLKSALDVNPEFKKAYETNENCKRILEYGFVLEGLFRNQGTHAAGVVIGEKALSEIIPLTLDKDKQVITQYAMEPLGKVGLLKMDFLGLKTLTVIQEVVDLIRATQGVTLDISNLPMDDKPTYELLQRGDTVGVFQLESSGMRDLVRRVGVDRIEDLIALIALYRPGPMNMLDDYVNRKTGKARIEYDHPLLEPILKETYGVMVYQEQVQKAANVLAGYSLGQGDILRRAMGKKKASEMEAQRTSFVEGCARSHRIPKEKAERIFDTLAKFAGYGFNKSHSAAYGIVAYQTAYLKAHYPAEFMAGLLSSEMGNMDKLPGFVAEARAMGLEVLPPHINDSDVRFKPVGRGIRFGLAGIKNVGEGAARELVAERERNGPFKGLMDFCARLASQQVNRKTIESLIRCGAFDMPGMDRARLFNGIEFAMNRASSAQRDRLAGQASLFELLKEDVQAVTEEQLPETAPWHESELLAGERELLGIYMSGHPLSQHARLLERYQLTSVKKLASLPNGTMTRLGGLISSLDQKITKKKETMAVLRIEDLDGSVEVIVYPEAYREYAAVLAPEQAVLLCGEVRQEEEPKMIAAEIYPLVEAPAMFAERVSLHVAAAHMDASILAQVKDVLRLHPGRTPVIICIQFPNGEKVFLDTDNSYKVTASENLVEAIEHLLGEGSVYVAVNASPCRKARPARKKWARNGEAQGA
jgi:DNA polymerase III subunit alpha